MPVTSVIGARVSAPSAWARSRMIVPGAERIDDADPRRREATEDDVGVDVGHHRLDLLGRHQLRLDPPRARRRHPALELLHPLGRPGDLDPAALGEDAHLLVLLDAIGGERRHLARVVGQEDEVRGVTGRAAGVRQRTLLDLDDVLPAKPGEVVDKAVADDAGADDDDARGIRLRAQSVLLSRAPPWRDRDRRATMAMGGHSTAAPDALPVDDLEMGRLPALDALGMTGGDRLPDVPAGRCFERRPRLPHRHRQEVVVARSDRQVERERPAAGVDVGDRPVACLPDVGLAFAGTSQPRNVRRIRGVPTPSNGIEIASGRTSSTRSVVSSMYSGWKIGGSKSSPTPATIASRDDQTLAFSRGPSSSGPRRPRKTSTMPGSRRRSGSMTSRRMESKAEPTGRN